MVLKIKKILKIKNLKIFLLIHNILDFFEIKIFDFVFFSLH